MSNNTSPIKKDIIKAINLSQKAEKKAVELYTDFYTGETGKTFFISSSKCLIPKPIFLNILNDCLILSQQKIEERPILTKFIFPSNKNLEWPKGVNFIPIQEVPTPSLGLSNLKKFLEIGSEPNTFLVLKIVKNENFVLKGFIFVEKSLNNLVFRIRQRTLRTNQEFIAELKGLYNSIIFSIDNGKINACYLNRIFLSIEKGMISSPPDLLLETEIAIIISKKFHETLQSIPGEDLSGLSIQEIYERSFDEERTKKVIRLALIQYRVSGSLTNIIKRISNARHGSTLIFGFDGNIKDENLFHPGAIELRIPFGSSFLKLENPNIMPEPEDQDILNLIESFENAIVSLSKTDGAMVFDQNLNLVLAGAFLKTRSSGSLSGGARRKSAEGFVRDNNKTIAIVISQDGSIKFLPELSVEH